VRALASVHNVGWLEVQGHLRDGIAGTQEASRQSLLLTAKKDPLSGGSF
jgi:hypothetical protein